MDCELWKRQMCKKQSAPTLFRDARRNFDQMTASKKDAILSGENVLDGNFTFFIPPTLMQLVAKNHLTNRNVQLCPTKGCNGIPAATRRKCVFCEPVIEPVSSSEIEMACNERILTPEDDDVKIIFEKVITSSQRYANRLYECSNLDFSSSGQSSGQSYDHSIAMQGVAGLDTSSGVSQSE